MRHDETIMEMLARILRSSCITDAERAELDDYLDEQQRQREARNARLRARFGGNSAANMD